MGGESADRYGMPPLPASLLTLDVPIVVELASRRLSAKDVLALAPGDLIELPRRVDEPLDVRVGKKLVGRGEAVRIGDHFGVRLTEVGAMIRVEAGESGIDATRHPHRER